MIFEPLSSNAEKLLAEILEHKLENGSCDIDYWESRFSVLNDEEDTRLRSLFRELCEEGMIDTSWADGVPDYITVYDKGHSYEAMKSAYEKEQRRSNGSSFIRDMILVIAGAIAGGGVSWLLHAVWGIG